MLAALERGVVATWTALELKKGIDRRLIEVHFSAFRNEDLATPRLATITVFHPFPKTVAIVRPLPAVPTKIIPTTIPSR